MAGVRRQVHSPSRGRSGVSYGLSLINFFFWTFLLVSAAIAYLWIYNQTDVVAAMRVEKKALIQELENTNREFQARIDDLARIDRITRIARDDLNMYVPPAESLIVYLPQVQP